MLSLNDALRIVHQAGDDVGRHLAQFAAILDIGKDDLECVAPKTTDHFAVADDLEQALRDLFQQRVARRMAERVVDLLEPVEVDQHDRARALLLRERRERRVELFRDVEAVGEPGQRVIEREPRGVLGRSTLRSEEHTSELQSLMRISYAVFCLKTKKNN